MWFIADNLVPLVSGASTAVRILFRRRRRAPRSTTRRLYTDCCLRNILARSYKQQDEVNGACIQQHSGTHLRVPVHQSTESILSVWLLHQLMTPYWLMLFMLLFIVNQGFIPKRRDPAMLLSFWIPFFVSTTGGCSQITTQTSC